MNCRFPHEGSRATEIIGSRDAFERERYNESDLGVTELISLKVKIGFSTQSVNEKSD